MSNFFERVWFLYGLWVGKTFIALPRLHNIGEPSGVQFNWKKAMHPFLVGWVHTHPDKSCEASSEDNKTMRSWVRAIDRKLICGIYAQEECSWYVYFRGSDQNIWRSSMDVCYKGQIYYGKEKGKQELV